MLWSRFLLNSPHRDNWVSVDYSCVNPEPIPSSPLYDGEVLDSNLMV